MKVINLTDVEKSEVKYKYVVAPESEPYFTIESELDLDEQYLVIACIKSYKDLLILRQCAELLNYKEMVWELYITYLMTSRYPHRLDVNVADFGKIIYKDITNTKPYAIRLLDCGTSRPVMSISDRFNNAPAVIRAINIIDQVPHLEYLHVATNEPNALNIKRNAEGVLELDNPEILETNKNIPLIYVPIVVNVDELIKLKELMPKDRDCHLVASYITNQDTLDKTCKEFNKVYFVNCFNLQSPDNAVELFAYQMNNI